jgi:Bacterial regulatory proteins, tetR family
MIDEKERFILRAAREHFLRDGFAGASMDGIAKYAGVDVDLRIHQRPEPQRADPYADSAVAGRLNQSYGLIAWIVRTPFPI